MGSLFGLGSSCYKFVVVNIPKIIAPKVVVTVHSGGCLIVVCHRLQEDALGRVNRDAYSSWVPINLGGTGLSHTAYRVTPCKCKLR